MAQSRPDAAPWWRSAVIYQVYVRSFADGDGDGTGDLAGVRARLPYLAELGVRRISVGGALARVAWGGLTRMAREIAEQGTFTGFAHGTPSAELNKLFSK